MVLDLLRQAIYGKILDKKYVASHSGSSAPHSVSEAEWLSYDDRFYNDMSGGYKLIETSSADMAKIEELLQVEPGFFASPYVVKTKEEHCNKCGRQNNFLDVVATALRVHRPSFLVDVFTGKFGYIINTQNQQPCICYGCGTVLPPNATKRSSPKPLSPEDIIAGKKRAFYYFG
jgi:hypothetical protein